MRAPVVAEGVVVVDIRVVAIAAVVAITPVAAAAAAMAKVTKPAVMLARVTMAAKLPAEVTVILNKVSLKGAIRLFRRKGVISKEAINKEVAMVAIKSVSILLSSQFIVARI